MGKLKVYLDTSVISHLLQEDVPEKMADTRQLWEMFCSNRYDVYLSTVTLEELKGCSEPKQSLLFDFLRQIDYTLIHIQSHQPDQNTHQMYKTGKSNCQFIVPCGNATIIFDLLEKTFHPAALFILPPVHIPWFGCIRFWRNTVSCSGFSDFYSKVLLLHTLCPP